MTSVPPKKKTVHTSEKENLWECSSPDDSPSKAATAAGGGKPATASGVNSGVGMSAPGATRSLDSHALDDLLAEFPAARSAESKLVAERSLLQETLLEHDRQVMTREETLLALTREAKLWRQRTVDLQKNTLQLQQEKDEMHRRFCDELDVLREAHRQELEESRVARNKAEVQLQRLVIDYDEARQQLAITRKQLREQEALREETSAALEAMQRRFAQVDVEERERRHAKDQEHQSSHHKFDSLRGKFDALERLCETLRREKEDVEKQARHALVELHDLRSKREHRVLIDAQELYDKEQQLLRVEEQLQTAHLSNARLLRLMAECPDLHSIIRFNEITQEFVFVGYHALTDSPTRVDPHALIPHADAQEEDPVLAATQESRSMKPHATGGAFGVMAGTGQTKNAYLRSLVPTSKNAPPLSAVPNAMRHLHDAILEENHFLRHRGIKISEAAHETGVGAIVPPSNNLLECKSNEKYYWIPRAVLAEAQEFKAAYFPKLQMGIFFPFLIRLNQVWRQRQEHLLRDARRTTVSGAVRRSASPPNMVSRAAYEDANAHRLEDDVVLKELDALRREVRLRVSSKAAQQLCKQYDHLSRLQIQRRAHMERRYEELAAVHQHTLADRAPETVAMQSHLRTLADSARSLSSHIARKLVGASNDIKRFLTSLDAASTRSAVMQAGVVSASVLKQLMDCLKDYTDEVKMEASVTTDSLRRIADAAERAATEPPPSGYVLRDSDNAATSDEDQRPRNSRRGRAASSDGRLRHEAATRDRYYAYDDLVDDVVSERLRAKHL